MSVSGINHINIKAPKALLEEVKGFYINVLGLKAGFRPEFSSEGYWLYANTQPLIHLSENNNRKMDGELSCFDHFALSCTNIEHFTKQLQEANIVFTSKFLPEIQTTQLFLKDPAGIRIELNFKNEKLA